MTDTQQIQQEQTVGTDIEMLYDDWDAEPAASAPQPEPEQPTPVTNGEEEGQPNDAEPDEDDEDDGEEEEPEQQEGKPQPKKLPRGLREKHKRIAAEKKAEEAQKIAAERDKELQVSNYRIQQLEETVRELLKERQQEAQPQLSEDEVNAILIENKLNPDSIVDKEAFAIFLQNNKKNNQQNIQSVQQIEQQIVGEKIKQSVITAQQTIPDYADAMAFYAQAKANEALAAAEAMGMPFTEEDANNAVLEKVQYIMLQAHKAKQDPAQAVYRIAQKIGYKSKPLTTEPKIDHNKLTQLRDAAGTPAYQAESANAKRTMKPLTQQTLNDW